MADSVADDPKLAPLWDVGQNPQAASKVEARSFRPAVWRCEKGHSFQRSPRSMQNDASCPTCSKGVNTHTNLGKLRPGLASLWDADKNPGIVFATLDATYANPVLPQRGRRPGRHRRVGQRNRERVSNGGSSNQDLGADVARPDGQGAAVPRDELRAVPAPPAPRRSSSGSSTRP